MANIKKLSKKTKFFLNNEGGFVIENYDLAKPFSSFFPGVAGIYGIPLWVFYVNRGQCIASFGSKNKDGAILEFFPANKAYQNTSLKGFRTFLKVKKGKNTLFYEPFQNNFLNSNYDVTRKMIINSADLRLEETNKSLGIVISVNYFSIPEESFGGLTRIVTIENISKKPLNVELLDGLPIVMPYGVNDRLLKDMCRTLEAWMNVEQLDKKNIAVYKLKAYVSDKPEVISVKQANFYTCFHKINQKTKSIKPIVESEYVFGPITDFTHPYEFFKKSKFTPPEKQITDNKTPGAFAYIDFKLNPKSKKELFSVFGYTNHSKNLDSSVKNITKKNYLQQKNNQNTKLIHEITDKMFTASSLRNFDLYCKQTFLDNTLRGGYPIIFDDNSHAFHVYWRKHGDPERDYNNFTINPAYFSEGNGNYRDINQNRRNDTWFNPQVKDINLITFLNLIQADGFNPLTFRGFRFTLKNPKKGKKIVKKLVAVKYVNEIVELLKNSFVPGEIFTYIENNNIKPKVSYDEFIAKIVSICETNIIAEHNEGAETLDGYWTDHWTYNTDALESYLSIYPEKLRELLLKKRVFAFYDNPVIVMPREEKYVIKNNKVRQFNAIGLSLKNKKMIDERASDIHWVRESFGKGKIYKTNLIAKLSCLICNKIASLDPFGIGIEMEAGRPNWYDALNGLPGLFGSSLNETLELKRLIDLLNRYIAELDIPDDYEITLFDELFVFFEHIDALLKEYLKNANSNKDFSYWDKSNSAKEAYRKSIELGFSGQETKIQIKHAKQFFENCSKKLDEGIKKSYKLSKHKSIPPTYLYCDVKSYKQIQQQDFRGNSYPKLNNHGLPCIKPLSFSQRALPLFLEAPMHALKLEKNKRKALTLYKAIRKSGLFDKKLKMYKVCASLDKETKEIGRTKIFTPGWLENESIWLHMEYKYLLETLRKGLYEQFFRDFKEMLIPFQDPQVYGRNILENSSFIASSSNPDKKLHGNGFVARLSGSTAELLHMWLLMMAGEQPFFLNNEEKLCLKFNPSLPKWIFSKTNTEFEYFINGKKEKFILEKNCLAFVFLGKILVVYHNNEKGNTFGASAKKPQSFSFNLDNKNITIDSDFIPSPYAERIRNCETDRIDIYLY